MPHEHVSSTALSLRQDLQFTGIGRIAAGSDCSQRGSASLTVRDSGVGVNAQISAQGIRDIDAARRYACDGFAFENFYAAKELIKTDHRLVALITHLSHDKFPVGVAQSQNPG